MRILFEGTCRANYLAKLHEAFRTGLRRMFDARMFGKGYDCYDSTLRTYQEIIDYMFPEAPPDLLIVEANEVVGAKRFRFDGLSEVRIPKVTWMADYWDVNRDEFLDSLEHAEIGMVMSYFLQPLEMYAHTSAAHKFVYLPPSFDPATFNDWQMEKQYDVGFLAAGTADYTAVYPERYAIHQKLLNKPSIRYLWAQHPGWKEHPSTHPLVGVGFSKHINSCHLFVTTGGPHRNANPKYIEILASKSVLLADEPKGAHQLHLEDGVNYVKISESDILDKVDYYLMHPGLCKEVAEAGYRTAMQYHTCYTRAYEFYKAARGILY